MGDRESFVSPEGRAAPTAAAALTTLVSGRRAGVFHPGSTTPVKRFVASRMGRRLAGSAFWSLSGSIGSRLLALLAAVLVARQLGATAFGEFNLVQTTAGMLMALGGFGLNTTATKFLAGKYREDPRAAGRVIGLSGMMAGLVGGVTGIVLAVGAPFVAREVLGAPGLAGPLRLGSLLLLFGPVNGAQLGVLMGLERFRLIAIVTAAAAALSVPLLVLGARHGGMGGAVAALVLTAALTTVLYQGAMRMAAHAAGIRPAFRDAFAEWRILFSYSVPTTLGNMLLAPVTWITSAVIANQLDGVRQLGLYAAANQWRNAILLLATSAGAVLFPLFSHLHDSGRPRSFSRAFWVSFGVTAAASLLAAAVLSAAAPRVMRAYGAEFADGAGVMVLLVVTGALAAPLAIVGHAIAGAGRMWLGLGLNVAWAVVLLTATYVLRTRGAAGLSVANLAASAVHLVLSLICAWAVLRRAQREATARAGTPSELIQELPHA